MGSATFLHAPGLVDPTSPRPNSNASQGLQILTFTSRIARFPLFVDANIKCKPSKNSAKPSPTAAGAKPIEVAQLLRGDNSEQAFARLVRQHATSGVSGVVPKFLDAQRDAATSPLSSHCALAVIELGVAVRVIRRNAVLPTNFQQERLFMLREL